ncbi:hypothetical protein [Streptomyces tsukubensis]|uniref:hypothetical protein n=1 Tax=Streptomyces tsukubensis TaxID=83656 RepID=UPI00344F9A00
MDVTEQRAVGVDGYAESVVVSACELADVVAVSGWTPEAVDDTLEAVEVLAAALASAVGGALAPVAAAVAEARARLAADADPNSAGDGGPAAPIPDAAVSRRPVPQARRRGLGPGYRGIPQAR